jgi:PAS domain S-box-containing protein
MGKKKTDLIKKRASVSKQAFPDKKTAKVIPQQKKPPELRKRAEEELKSQTITLKVMSDKETQQLIHELQVHQMELEMQNDELRKAQAELEESRTRYSDLYDFAPVGYFTFDKHGLILEANLTAAKELGIERSGLINKPFRTYIVTEDREIFDQHLQKVYRSDERQTCEIKLKKKDGSDFYAQLESIAANDLKGNSLCRTSVMDITKLKLVEEELRDEKAFNESALNNLRDVFFVFDLNGKFMRWNKAMNTITGFSDSEISLMKPGDFFVREDIPRVEEAIAIVLKKEFADLEATVLTKDGRHIPFEIAGSLLKNKHGEAVGISGISRDITERKQAEEALILSRNQMEAVSQIGVMANSTLDISEVLSHILTGTLKATGASVGMIFLRDPETGCLEWGASRGLSEAFVESYRDQVIKPGEGLTGLIAQTGEIIYIAKDSSHDPRIARTVIKAEGLNSFIGVPVYAEDKIVAVMNILTRSPDVLREEKIALIKAVGTHIGLAIRNARLFKERKQVENALRQSEEKYRLAMEATLDGLWDWDIQSGTVIYSLSWYRILGIKQTNPTYEGWESRIHPDDKSEWLSTLQSHLDGLTDYWRNEHRLKTDTGEWLWVLGRGRVVERGNKWKPIRMLGTITDISERKKAEDALRASEEKFRSLVSSSLYHIFIIGKDGRYLLSNGRIEQFGNIQGRSIIGLGISDVYPQDTAGFYKEQVDHVFSTGEKIDFEHTLSKPDGLHYYLDTLFPIERDGDIWGVGGICRDITEIKQAAEEKEALSLISQLFLTRNNLEDIYKELPWILSERFMFPIVTMELYDQEEGTFRLVASIGGEYSAENEPFCVPIEHSIAGKAILTGKPFHNLNADKLSQDHLGILAGVGIRTLICIPIPGKNIILGTITLADTRRRRGLKASIKILQVIANHLAQELERLKAWDALSKAKDEWEHTFDAVPDLICILDKEFRIVRINHAMAERLGMHPAECIGQTCYQSVHHTNEPPDFCPHAALLKDGGEHIAEVHEERLGGDFIVTTSPIYDEKSQLVGSVHVARDITDRKRIEEEIMSSLEEKEILLREIHHRVKNNMQIISSLLKLSTEYIHDKSILNIFAESQDRIKSMALIHEKLYQSTDLTKIDFSEYIESLANELYRAHGVDPEKVALKLSMEPVFLSIDNAIPCGLIVNELITNALKHAFSKETEGEIFISLADKGSGVIELIISDNGIGMPSSIDLSTAKTLGLYIVNILAEDQLDGSITLDRTKGTAFRVRFSKKDEKIK